MASKLAKFAIFLYTWAAGMILIEILQSFTSSDNPVLLEVVSWAAAFALSFETWGFFCIYACITFLAIKVLLKISARILFHFRPVLREKVKEYLRKRQEERKLKDEAKEKPSAFTHLMYYMFWPLMIVNGAISQREEGTSLVEGAMQRFVTAASTNFYIFVIEVSSFLVFFSLAWAMIWIFRASRRSCTARTPVEIEEGRTEEISEVRGGIYSTAATYIQTSILDEKLIDLDEPVQKLVDVDEPAPQAVEPVTRAPVDLL